jgi:hypothetical protein
MPNWALSELQSLTSCPYRNEEPFVPSLPCLTREPASGGWQHHSRYREHWLRTSSCVSSEPDGSGSRDILEWAIAASNEFVGIVLGKENLIGQSLVPLRMMPQGPNKILVGLLAALGTSHGLQSRPFWDGSILFY